MQFQLVLKHRQGTKITKMLSTSHSSVLHKKFTISKLKSKQVFHPNGNWPRTSTVPESSTRSQNFMPPTDSEHKFHKSGNQKLATYRIQSGIALIGNSHSWPQYYVQRVMGRVLRFYIPIHNLLEKPWRHFTTMKLCKCYQLPSLITQISINPHKTKTNHHTH